MSRTVKLRHRHHPVRVVGRGVGRFVGGRDLIGPARTNAGFVARGDRIHHRSGRANKWSHLPGYRRAGVRLGTLVLALYATLGLYLDPAGTAPTLRALLWFVVLPMSLWLTVHNARREDKYKRRLRPTALALGELLSISRHVDPRSWIEVPDGYREDPAKPVVITLPQSFHGAEVLQNRIAEIAGSRLDMPQPEAEWRYSPAPQLILRATPLPPLMCTYAMLSPLLDKAEPGERILGIGTRNTTVAADMSNVVPHMALSAPTGEGKSYTTGAIVMQVLHEGGIGLILDIKLASIPWARNLPNVRYCDEVPAIHNALVWLTGEMERRYQALKGSITDEGETDADIVGPELIVVLEEVNSLIAELEMYWASIREKGDPKLSPAIAAIRKGLAMGRQAKIRFLVVAQYLTAVAIGGPAARQNLPTRILIQPDRNTWNMLAPECKQPGGRYPNYGSNPGRAVIILRGKAVACQLAFVPYKTAKLYASNGIVTPFPGELPGGFAGSDVAEPVDNVIHMPAPREPQHVDAVRLVTLRQAWESKKLPGSWDAVKKARSNARKKEWTGHPFPDPEKIVGQTEYYDPDALIEFYEIRKEFTS